MPEAQISALQPPLFATDSPAYQEALVLIPYAWCVSSSRPSRKPVWRSS
jgi:hypothetical protein